jgi:hypothetical protein
MENTTRMQDLNFTILTGDITSIWQQFEDFKKNKYADSVIVGAPQVHIETLTHITISIFWKD